MEILLASNSIRRKELLEENGFKVLVVNNEVDESIILKINNPREYVRRVSMLKMRNFIKNNKVLLRGKTVITADTVVYFNNEYLGKPYNFNEVFQMISKLSGNYHKVYTGVSIYYNNKLYTLTSESEVLFRNLSRDEIRSYANTNLWMGKAGGYGIQDRNSLVSSYSGDINNVIGLPVSKVISLINKIVIKNKLP